MYAIAFRRVPALRAMPFMGEVVLMARTSSLSHCTCYDSGGLPAQGPGLNEALMVIALFAQAEARVVRKFSEYAESGWVTHQSELPCLPGGFAWSWPPPQTDPKGAQFSGRMRKVR